MMLIIFLLKRLNSFLGIYKLYIINVKHFLCIENLAQSSILFGFKGDFFSINPGTDNITGFPRRRKSTWQLCPSPFGNPA